MRIRRDAGSAWVMACSLGGSMGLWRRWGSTARGMGVAWPSPRRVAAPWHRRPTTAYGGCRSVQGLAVRPALQMPRSARRQAWPVCSQPRFRVAARRCCRRHALEIARPPGRQAHHAAASRSARRLAASAALSCSRESSACRMRKRSMSRAPCSAAVTSAGAADVCAAATPTAQSPTPKRTSRQARQRHPTFSCSSSPDLAVVRCVRSGVVRALAPGAFLAPHLHGKVIDI